MYFQSVLTDKVHQPLATVRVVPLYQMCGRVAYLCVAFLPHIAKVCEKFVSFEWIFLYKPCTRSPLKALHWLPVKERITFKVATFVFCFFDGTLPPYLLSCFSAYIPFSHSSIPVQRGKKPFCSREKLKGFSYWSFSVKAPLVWNNLPAHIRHCSSLS